VGCSGGVGWVSERKSCAEARGARGGGRKKDGLRGGWGEGRGRLWWWHVKCSGGSEKGGGGGRQGG